MRVTYNTIFDEITRQLNIDAAAILFLDSHAMTLTYEASRGLGLLIFQITPAHREDMPAKRAWRSGRFDSDLKAVEPDPCQGAIFGEGFRSYFAFPLMAKGNPGRS